MVDLGDDVARHQVLAAIRPLDYRARVSELDASLAQAERDVQRTEQLGENVAREELELVRTRLKEARAQRKLASRQLTDTTVRAPFAASVALRHVAPGTYVKPGTPLFDLVALDELRLTLEVPERYAALVRVGTPVAIGAAEVLPASQPEGRNLGMAPAAQVTATVTRVAPIVSRATRTFTVEAVFSPEGSVLRPGMFITATLALGVANDGVRVPRSAVFHVLGHDRVMEVVDGIANARDVEWLGEVDGDVIVAGIPADTQVIVRGPALVAPGSEVVASLAADPNPEGDATP